MELPCHRRKSGGSIGGEGNRSIGIDYSFSAALYRSGFYGALAVAYDQLGTAASWEQIEQYAAEECGRIEAALRIIQQFSIEINTSKEKVWESL